MDKFEFVSVVVSVCYCFFFTTYIATCAMRLIMWIIRIFGLMLGRPGTRKKAIAAVLTVFADLAVILALYLSLTYLTNTQPQLLHDWLYERGSELCGTALFFSAFVCAAKAIWLLARPFVKECKNEDGGLLDGDFKDFV